MPVDVSRDALDIACEKLASLLPEVCVEPIVANYVTHPPHLEFFEGTTLAIYLGSSIGNFSPEEVRASLQNLSSQLQSGDALLLRTDMVKDESILLAAYDDRDGITAEFNTNILSRLNRELDADFDPTSFRHRAVWNRSESPIEMHLESAREQNVRILQAGLDLRLKALETIHAENSYKFTHEAIRILLKDAGCNRAKLDRSPRMVRRYACTKNRGTMNENKIIAAILTIAKAPENCGTRPRKWAQRTGVGLSKITNEFLPNKTAVWSRKPAKHDRRQVALL